jgi:hypothetical protein
MHATCPLHPILLAITQVMLDDAKSGYKIDRYGNWLRVSSVHQCYQHTNVKVTLLSSAALLWERTVAAKCAARHRPDIGFVCCSLHLRVKRL